MKVMRVQKDIWGQDAIDEIFRAGYGGNKVSMQVQGAQVLR